MADISGENRGHLPPARADWLVRLGLSGAGLAILSALVSIVVGGIAVRGTMILWPAAGLAIAGGVVVGGGAATAVAGGYLVGAAVAGSADPTAVVAAGSLFLFGYAAAFLWRRRIALPLARDSRIGPGVRFVVVAVIASVAGGASMAWGGEITRHSPFFTGFGYVLSYLLSALAIGFPLWILLRRIRRVTRGPQAVAGDRHPGRVAAVAGISIAWLFVGTLGSIGYRGVRTVLTRFPYTFEIRDAEVLLVLYDDSVFGVGASHVQAVLGGAMLGVLLWAFLDGGSGRETREAEGRG